jgi:hypothetical protein
VLFASPTIRACALFIENALKEKYAASLIQSDLEDESEQDDAMII